MATSLYAYRTRNLWCSWWFSCYCGIFIIDSLNFKPTTLWGGGLLVTCVPMTIIWAYWLHLCPSVPPQFKLSSIWTLVVWPVLGNLVCIWLACMTLRNSLIGLYAIKKFIDWLVGLCGFLLQHSVGIIGDLNWFISARDLSEVGGCALVRFMEFWVVHTWDRSFTPLPKVLWNKNTSTLEATG